MISGIEYKTKQKIVAIFKSILNREPSGPELTSWYYKAEVEGYNIDVVRRGITPKTTPTGNVNASSIWNGLKAWKGLGSLFAQ